MTVDSLEHYSKDELIAELINRETFVGVVIYHRGDAKNDQVEPGETVVAKSPPLTQFGVESLFKVGLSLVPGMFGEESGPQAQTFSLRQDASGALRIGKSRVLLDLVIRAFQDGATPEAIIQCYSTLTLADAYSTIAYYLRHRDEIDNYLAKREQKAGEIQKRIESQQGDLGSIRERLLAQKPA